MVEQSTHHFPDPTTDPLEAACQAMAICIAKQDGVALSPAGYRHGRAERPEAHREMREYVQAGLDAAGAIGRADCARKFQLRDRVSKTKGSSWNGRVVGFYSTAMTPIGYAVESEREPGSVQIYPESALALATDANGGDHVD